MDCAELLSNGTAERSPVAERFMFTCGLALVLLLAWTLGLTPRMVSCSQCGRRHVVWSLVSLAEYKSETRISEAELILSLNLRLH